MPRKTMKTADAARQEVMPAIPKELIAQHERRFTGIDAKIVAICTHAV